MDSKGRFRIEFEGYPETVRGLGWLPFKLLVRPDIERRERPYSFGVFYAEIDLDYDDARTQLGEALDQAAVRWAISRVEERFRHGSIPPKSPRETEKLVLSPSDLDLLKVMVREKECAYQQRIDRDLFCSAAAPTDTTAVVISGRRLAPTSTPICKQCNLPDSKHLCSHLTHPRVIGLRAIGTDGRQVVGAYCELGRSEIAQDPSRCRAGGHGCWARIVEPQPRDTAPSFHSPRELSNALDFLNAIWERSFGRPLLQIRSFAKAASLSLPCLTAEDLQARLNDLNELLKLIDIPDTLLPENRQSIDKQQILNRMQACLQSKITHQEELEKISSAMNDLRSINTVRNKIIHGGSELIEALERLAIGYPIRDHEKAWDQIRSRVTEAFTTVRTALQNT